MEVFILGVDADYRGNGIAKNLITKAEKYARDEGAEKIIINTHILQEGVQKLYKKLGYLEMGILENFFDNGSAIFFSKNL